MKNVSEILTSIDVALSFTDAALSDVDLVQKEFSSIYKFYDYRKFLGFQSGNLVENIASEVYSKFPTIIFATRDWFFRPATTFEARILSKSVQKKLVVDYTGDFRNSELAEGIRGVYYGDFIDDSYLNLSCVNTFLQGLYREGGLDSLNRGE